MNETTYFIFYTLLASLIVLALTLLNDSIRTSGMAARRFYSFCLFLSSALLITTILSVSGTLPAGASRLFFQAFAYPVWLVVGAGLSSTVLMLANAYGHSRSRITSEAVRSFVSSGYLLKGLRLFCSASFLAADVAKSAHDAEMRQFFLESGYTVWFLYLITTAEALGAVLLFVSKTTVPAAFGLTIIMLGAIYTHFHNGDPFSDSLDALRLLILLICIIALSLLRRKVSNRL